MNSEKAPFVTEGKKNKDNNQLSRDRRNFFEGLGFYEISPMPLFRLDLPTKGTFLVSNKAGFLWLENSEDAPDNKSIGFGEFTNKQIETLVSTMLSCGGSVEKFTADYEEWKVFQR